MNFNHFKMILVLFLIIVCLGRLFVQNTYAKFTSGYETSNDIANLNLSFDYGEFVCILGESGCGKSTLMNIIGGLDLNYEGIIRIDGKNLKKINLDNYRNKEIGFVFQNFNLISNISVFENVLLVLNKIKGNSIKKRSEVKKILKKLGLSNVMYKKPSELSGGQKQRVAIARALIKNPKILLCDEPTGALDYENSRKILEILLNEAKSGRLVIVVTHSKRVIDYSTRIIEFTKRNEYVEEILRDPYNSEMLSFNKTKNLNFLSSINISLNNIFKNLKRNILITIGSSIGIVGVILTLSLGNSVKKYINDEISIKMDPLKFDVKKKNINELYDNYYYTKEDINEINNIKHVDKIYEGLNIPSSSSLMMNTDRYDLVTLSTINNINKLKLKDGIKSKKGIYISEYLADKLSKNLPVEDILYNDLDLYIVDNSKSEPFIIKTKVKINGIIKKENIDFIENSSYAYISYNELKDIYNENNFEFLPNLLSVKIDNRANVSKVRKSFSQLDFDLSNNNKIEKEIYNYLDIATFVLTGFCIISLIVSMIMITIVMHINVIERTKEIGILRSIGFKKREVKKIFIGEAFIIGLLIGLTSSVISIYLGNLINEMLYNSFKLNILFIEYRYLVFGILVSIFIVVFASLIPAKKASKIDPVEALRYEI